MPRTVGFGSRPAPSSRIIGSSGICRIPEINSIRMWISIALITRSVFWSLTDVEEGGETFFNDLDYGVKPKKGRMLMFPPFWMYPHPGVRPISGTKYILGTYLNFAE